VQIIRRVAASVAFVCCASPNASGQTGSVNGSAPPPVTVPLVLPANTDAIARGGIGISDSTSVRQDGSTDRRLGDRWSIRGLFQPDPSRLDAGSSIPTWHMRMGATYAAPAGLHVTAAASLRRGHQLPLFMMQPLGSDAVIPGDGVSWSDTSAPPVWDTELRVQKRLATHRRWQLDAVGEVFNLFDMNRRAVTPVLPSRTIRAGLIVTF
jgi:hypothetical protein